MASQKTPSLVQLAEQILAAAKDLEAAVSAPPDFQNDTLTEIPESLSGTRKALIDATSTLNALARGSTGTYGRVPHLSCYQWLDQISLLTLYRFRIPQAVPLDSSISYADLAHRCALDTTQLSRLLRCAMAAHLLHSPTPGQIAHTADIRLLATDPTMWDFVGCTLTELRPAGFAFLDAMAQWPGSQELSQTAWNACSKTPKTFYEDVLGDSERARRVGGMIVQATAEGGREARLLPGAYPWAGLGEGATVVDVGGGNGDVSFEPAKVHSGLQFVVQDLPGVVMEGEKGLPEELRDHVRFMGHDFFQPQPVHGADALLFAKVFHSWSDKYAVSVVRALVPALKPGARVLILERALPERGTVSEVEYKEALAMDLMMMSLFNAGERTLEEMSGLFERADEKLKFRKAWKVEGTIYNLYEAIWTP
ncbi:hypothetical protein H2201_004183 [Coniosporium apollinis]|uniref:O-methyltransferase C-terminal domain-containing protein n=1 Tax=Coniosporium apollinis TaxID=61459 RepID=A0ABQ9NTG9_9PEZI|nr:hypothetical protein H2201_004183 [Coniosporium apollinis]